jgi:hypothetical protein
MLENDPRSDDYQDDLSHHHATRPGDLVAGWSIVLLLAAIAVVALGVQNLAGTGRAPEEHASRSASAASPPLAQEIGLIPRGQTW